MLPKPSKTSESAVWYDQARTQIADILDHLARRPARPPRARDVGALDDDLNRRANAALDLLPPLKRAAFLLARVDDLAYPDIAWRCGLSVAEVELRLADALFAIGRALDGHTTLAMRVRGALVSWRRARARYRLRGRHWHLDRPWRAQLAKLYPRDTWHRQFASKIKGLIH